MAEEKIKLLKHKNKNITNALVTGIDPQKIGFQLEPTELVEINSVKVFKINSYNIIVLLIENSENILSWKRAVRVAIQLGITNFFLVGRGKAVGEHFEGCIISDHINMSGLNPLTGKNEPEFGVRFPDMSDIYSSAMRKKILNQAFKKGYNFEEGKLLIPQKTGKLTGLEKKVLESDEIKAISREIFSGVITAKQAGGHSAGLILYNRKTDVFGLLRELF